jgi:glycosyltransferase involved in cell wall biosynthesis
MKIAFVNQPWNRVALPVRAGSVAIWTYEVARRLAKTHEVVVYAKRDPDQSKVEWHEGVQYRRVSVSQDAVLQKLVTMMRIQFLRKPLRYGDSSYFLGYIARVTADLRKAGCDVVHLHNFSQFAPIVGRLNPAVKLILHMHCEWLTQIPEAIIERRLRSVDQIIGVSEYLAGTIRRAFPARSAACHAIQNGVDIERFSAKPEPAPGEENRPGRILFVGRVSPEKGIHVLLAAFARVLEKYPTVRLEIVGGLGAAPREFILEGNEDPRVAELDCFFSGDYVAHLKQSLSASVAERVAFVGELAYTDLAKKYHAADVLVYPSVWNEPFGLPAVEAMACGLPVVATRSGGLQEIVEDGVTGLLVKRADVDDLARALITLLSDASMRERMGRAGRDRATEMFSWEKVTRALLELYQDTARTEA